MLRQIIWWLITNILSGFIGLVIGILFQKRIEKIWKYFSRQIKLVIGRRGTEPPVPECFVLGTKEISFLVIEGDGILSYTPETLHLHIESPPEPLPLEIEELKNKIALREESKKNLGEHYHWNGPMYALRKYAIERTISREELELRLTLVSSDYFTFQATILSLDENLIGEPARLTLRQKYLHGKDHREPIEFLAQAFGVSLAIISKDNKMIFGWREEKVGVRPSEIDVAVVEALHPELDLITKESGYAIYQCAVRGASEEIGIQVSTSQVTFLGFGVDTKYYQWNMVGLIRLSVTAADALDNRRRGSGGKWESRRYEIVSATPTEVFKYLRDKQMWPMGWVTTYWALVNEYGRNKVDSAAKKYLY